MNNGSCCFGYPSIWRSPVEKLLNTYSDLLVDYSPILVLFESGKQCLLGGYLSLERTWVTENSTWATD